MNDRQDEEPSTDTGLPWALLDRYFAGHCSPPEVARITAWASAAPERRSELDTLRAFWLRGAADAAQPDMPIWDTERAVAALTNRVRAEAHAAPTAIRNTARSRWIWLGAAVAAVAAAVIAGTSLSVGRSVGARSAHQPFREFATAPGNKSTVTLHDGTQLVLGPASHLRVPVDFGRGERAVELDGEALFTVIHDAAHPFAVRTARTVIRDIGTTFSVQAYAADDQERVAVREGQVSIGGQRVVAHDLALIDPSGRVALRRGIDVEPYLSWTQGGLVFDDTPLQDVVNAMARTFDLDITVADSALLTHRVTSSFGSESASEVLDAVSFAVGAMYTRSGRHVVLRRRTGAAGGAVPAQAAPPVLTARTVPPPR